MDEIGKKDSPNKPTTSLKADVVIGGGYYGYTTAIKIRSARPDLNVVVLEREDSALSSHEFTKLPRKLSIMSPL